MGVQISLHASNMVDPAQWEKAYEESLILVDKFNFIEFQKFNKFEGEYDNPWAYFSAESG